VTVGDALHRVVLERAGRLRVSVVNDRGEPIPEVAVRLRDEADRDVLSYVQYLYDAIPDRDRTDKLGRAVAMHLPPGPYTVYAERENVRSEPASFVVDSGETRELELTLPDPY
jgi:hypothetical protein